MGPKRCDVGSPTHSMSLHTTPDHAPEVVNAMANVIDRASGLWRGIVNKPLLSTKNHRSPMNSHSSTIAACKFDIHLHPYGWRRPQFAPLKAIIPNTITSSSFFSVSAFTVPLQLASLPTTWG